MKFHETEASGTNTRDDIRPSVWLFLFLGSTSALAVLEERGEVAQSPEEGHPDKIGKAYKGTQYVASVGQMMIGQFINDAGKPNRPQNILNEPGSAAAEEGIKTIFKIQDPAKARDTVKNIRGSTALSNYARDSLPTRG